MKKSNFELATRTGGVQIKGGSINFDMAGLDSFADAVLKRERVAICIFCRSRASESNCNNEKYQYH